MHIVAVPLANCFMIAWVTSTVELGMAGQQFKPISGSIQMHTRLEPPVKEDNLVAYVFVFIPFFRIT